LYLGVITREVVVTIRPDKGAKTDKAGADLLAKMKALAQNESKGDHIVQVRVAPKNKPPHANCSCACS
jgi:hypothetical protein